MSNQRTQKWLESYGYVCEEEPDWIMEGKKPDFFCSGPLNIWVEVKTFGEEDRFENLADAHLFLRERLGEVTGRGRAAAWVDAPLEAGHVRAIMPIIKRELSRGELDLSNSQLVIMHPKDAIKNQYVRFSFEAEDGKQAIISCLESASGKYGWPGILTPKPYNQTVKVSYSDGREEARSLLSIAAYESNISLALHVSESDDDFKLLLTAPISGTAKVQTVNRIRNAVAEANSQSKNANNYKEAPSMTIIHHDAALVAEDEMVLSALFGDLVYSFKAGDFSDGNLVLTQNGVFGDSKNTTTSAVCYFRNNANPLIVYNPWAVRKLVGFNVQARHITPDMDGSFSVKDVGRG